MIETDIFKLTTIKHNCDCTVSYNVEFKDCITVQQFLQSLSTIQDSLYGTITIRVYVPNNMLGKSLTKLVYKTNFIPEDVMYHDCHIVEATANGNYGVLDFILKIKI